MSDQLARKYRPGNWSEFVGQRPSVAVLYRHVRRGKLHHALLLHGERGCGKTSMARVIAMSLNCESGEAKPDQWPCRKCPSCQAVAEGLSPDVVEIDAASNGSVDTVRELIRQAGYGPSGQAKVYIIDEAHAASDAAFQAMLKTLEEPQLDGLVYFILVTTAPHKVPQTVRDRCHRFLFAPLPAQVIRDRLAYVAGQEGIEAEPVLLDALARAARGGMRDGLMRLEQVANAGVSTLAMWQEMTGEEDFAPGLLSAAADGDPAAMYARLDAALAATGNPGQVAGEVIRCLRDVLVLQVTGTGDDPRGVLASRLPPARVQAAMTVVWDLQAKVRTGDPQADLILAMSMISRKLCAVPASAGPIAQDASGQGNLARLRDVLGAPSGTARP
jgi:DNA polymerase-3 subunit gamma/tau